MKEKDAVVSYRLLQHLVVQAWDKMDQEQLLRVSAAVDAAMLEQMTQEDGSQQAL